MARHTHRRVLAGAFAAMGLAALAAPVMADAQGPTGPPGGCAETTNTIVGTPGDDVLIGTPQNDLILGRGGDDRAENRPDQVLGLGLPVEDRHDAGQMP